MLKTKGIWWEGPGWLSKDRDQWPSSSDISEHIDTQQLEERKNKIVNVFLSNQDPIHPFDNIINNCSSWFKVVRVATYVIRFIDNYLRPKELWILNPISTDELSFAKNLIIKYVQSSLFSSEINCLKSNKQLPSKSRLLSLNPFIDSKGVLRVGGRLEHSNLTFSEKHPIILCKSHRIAKLIAEFTHKNHLHAGASLLFSLIKQNFYILGCRNLTRKVIRECVDCIRQQKATYGKSSLRSNSVRATVQQSRLRLRRAYHASSQSGSEPKVCKSLHSAIRMFRDQSYPHRISRGFIINRFSIGS